MHEEIRSHIYSRGIAEIHSPTHEAWLAQRLSGVGGSDIRSIINGDAYACKRKLYYDKTAKPDYHGDDYALRRGHRLEPIARDYYAETTSRNVLHSFGSFVCKKSPHRRYNADGICKDPTLGWMLCEFKVLGEDSFKRAKSQGLPKSYLAQAQWGAGLLGLEYTSYGLYQPLSDELLTIDIPFDRELFTGLCALVDDFWGMVTNVNIPEQLPVDAFPCKSCDYRKQCKGIGSNGRLLKTKPGEPQ